jgi:hypothetical protein
VVHICCAFLRLYRCCGITVQACGCVLPAVRDKRYRLFPMIVLLTTYSIITDIFYHYAATCWKLHTAIAAVTAACGLVRCDLRNAVPRVVL